MTAHGSDLIALAPGHTITRSGVWAKEKELDGLPLSGVLDKVESIYSRTDDITRVPDREFFGSTARSTKYHNLISQKNWPGADKLFLDALVGAHSDYAKLLEAEEWLWAFSSRLCAEVGTARTAYRWLDPPELKSYVNGTYESRVKGKVARRGFKALSMNPKLNFELRKVVLEVPLDPGMRRSIRCVQYTSMPREIEVTDERISDPKSALFMTESEVRVPDGTAVPPDAVFTVKAHTEVNQGVVIALEKKYDVVRQAAP